MSQRKGCGLRWLQSQLDELSHNKHTMEWGTHCVAFYSEKKGAKKTLTVPKRKHSLFEQCWQVLLYRTTLSSSLFFPALTRKLAEWFMWICMFANFASVAWHVSCFVLSRLHSPPSFPTYLRRRAWFQKATRLQWCSMLQCVSFAFANTTTGYTLNNSLEKLTLTPNGGSINGTNHFSYSLFDRSHNKFHCFSVALLYPRGSNIICKNRQCPNKRNNRANIAFTTVHCWWGFFLRPDFRQIARDIDIMDTIFASLIFFPRSIHELAPFRISI